MSGRQIAPICLPDRETHVLVKHYDDGRIRCRYCGWWGFGQIGVVQVGTRTLVRKPSSQLARVIAVYGDKCCYCDSIPTTVEHLIPRSRGGTNHISNLRPSCHTCNHRKGDRTPSEWLGDRCPPQWRDLVAPLPRVQERISRSPLTQPVLPPGIVLDDAR